MLKQNPSNKSEAFEPMLGYCSKLITELNKEDCNKLSEDLLELLKDFRPIFNNPTVKNKNFKKHVE